MKFLSLGSIVPGDSTNGKVRLCVTDECTNNAAGGWIGCFCSPNNCNPYGYQGGEM